MVYVCVSLFIVQVYKFFELSFFMNLRFLKASIEIDFQIPVDFTDLLKTTFEKGNTKNLALFSAVQFRKHHDEVSGILKEHGFTSQTSQPFRTSIEGQLLGCDSHKAALKMDLSEIDGFVYIGDGYFHPQALLLAQEFEDEIKPVLILNPVQNMCEILSREHIEKYLSKKKATLAAFHLADQVGVFVTTKWGQEYLQSALKLKEMYPQKTFLILLETIFLMLNKRTFPLSSAGSILPVRELGKMIFYGTKSRR